jgi:hypothetical protein
MATMQQLYEELLDCDVQLRGAIDLYNKGLALQHAYVTHIDRETLPVSVEYYLDEVSRSGLVSMEALIEVKSPITSSIKSILGALLRAIQWIIEQFVHLFRLIFDMYYRAQRKLTAQQQFILQFTDPTMRERFEMTSMKTIPKSVFASFNKQVNSLVLILQSSSSVVSFDHTKKLFTDSETELGCRVENATTLVNIVELANLEKYGTLRDLGWDYKAVYDTVGELLVTTHDTVTLKHLNKLVEGKARELEKEIKKNISDNAHPATVTTLQEQLSSERLVHEFVRSGLVVIATRIAWMDEYFSQFIDLMRSIQKGK